MDNFLNGFLKAWRSWRSDGREAFMRAFLQEIHHSKPNDSEHFFEILRQEMQAVSANLADQQDILVISDYINTLKEEIQHTLDNTLEQAQIEPESATQIEQQETQQLKPLFQELQEQQQIIHKMAQEIAQLKVPQPPESLEEQELLQSILIFKDEIQEVLTEHPNDQELEISETKNLVEQSQENNLRALSQSEQLNNSEQDLEVSNNTSETLEPKQTPPQATEIENKYAKLHDYFKQIELDVQQKRIKTKLDFKESFLNYAKNHMTEDELKVLLVLSQKQPSKLTQEHLNLINDVLEQAHGNKHMQDRGLQLSVKALLGHPLEQEHHSAIQDYVQQCQASLEPIDCKVAGVMNQYLDKMQRSREISQQEATQIRENTPEQRPNSTQPLPSELNQIQSNNQVQPIPATPNSTPLPDEPWLKQTQDAQVEQQTQINNQAQPVADNRPPPEPWLEAPAKPKGRRR